MPKEYRTILKAIIIVLIINGLILWDYACVKDAYNTCINSGRSVQVCSELLK